MNLEEIIDNALLACYGGTDSDRTESSVVEYQHHTVPGVGNCFITDHRVLGISGFERSPLARTIRHPYQRL